MDFSDRELSIIALALRVASQVETTRPHERVRRGFTPPPRVPAGACLALAERIEARTAKLADASRKR
jgi:hypothetical protein